MRQRENSSAHWHILFQIPFYFYFFLCKNGEGINENSIIENSAFKKLNNFGMFLCCAHVYKTEMIATNGMGFPCSRAAWGEVSCSNYLSSKRPQVNASYLVLKFSTVYPLPTQTQTDLKASSLREMNFLSPPQMPKNRLM